MTLPSPTQVESQSTKDLTEARSKCTFDTAVLNKLLNEGSRDSEMRSRVAKIIAEDPEFDKSKKAYMSRAERLQLGLRMTKRLFEQVDANEWDYMEYLEGLHTLDDPTGIYLHEVAFQPVITAQGTDEQQQYWVPKCFNHEILGCYMQTELGHGSNVQQLETTSTYIPETEEFELHSPTITSTKWWIGALGIMATHGVVQARLILKGKDMGPHLFICQLRSLEDHSLLPGIQAGEIGPKVHNAMSAVDNGWGRFDRVRIPRNQMLSRFAKVSKEGKYSKPPHDKLSYGGMIFIRAQMIGNLAWSLAKSTTIATRYLHIRRQFSDPELKSGSAGYGIERQVITYPSVYMRVLPQLAESIVFITIGKDMSNLYSEMSTQLASGDTTLLAETHAVSSGLKSYVSASVVDGSEVLRRAMGGHGFMAAAGVGNVIAKELPSATYEGDNFILNLQVARAALKTLGSVQSNSSTTLSPSSAYFSFLPRAASPSIASQITSATAWLDPEIQLAAISLRATLSVLRLQRLLANGKKFGDCSWDCVQVSRAVVEAFLVRRMLEAVTQEDGLLRQGAGAKEQKVLKEVINFYTLYTISEALPDLLEFGILSPSSPSASPAVILSGPVETLRAQVDSMAHEILPQAIGLVDSFGFSDFDLDSALGRFDGRAYETLLARAQNDLDHNAGDATARKKIYDESIKPILERGKRLSKL